jgi:transcriptional accessory protein Tex/SPT6
MSADVIEIIPEETAAEEVTPSGIAEAASPDTVETPSSLADLKPKMQLTGTVKRLELYGAFIDLGVDATGLIHISKLGAEQVNRVSDVLQEGQEVTVWVEKVDPARQQVMLTMVPPLAVDWGELDTDKVYTGKVTRLENFGAFVNIGAEREGLVHISELSHDYVKHPSEKVKVGDEVEVKVLGFNRRKRRIDLSMKALMEKPEMSAAPARGGGRSERPGQERSERRGGDRDRGDRRRHERRDAQEFEMIDDEQEEVPTAMEIALRRALGNETITAVKSEQRGGRKKKGQRDDQRRAQEDLLQRTLTMQSEN